MQIRPLDSRNKLEIHDLIMKDPSVNIFLLERLLHGNIQGWGIEEWHGVKPAGYLEKKAQDLLTSA